jgi:hypothetical protein
MGAGLGHVTRLRPIAEALIARGHNILLAAANVQTALRCFAELDISILQAPYNWTPRFQVKFPFTFTHILFNCGFAERDNLSARTRAWLDLFKLVQPQLILADYSPGALMAARAQGRTIATLGTGFEIPADESPLRNLRSGASPDPEQLASIERSTLENINRVLGEYGGRPLSHIAALYSEASEQFLMTFRELDPYPDRRNARYWGTTSATHGKSPIWPQYTGSKLFVYLKPHAGVTPLLHNLGSRDFCVIAYCDPPPADLQPELLSSNVRIENEPLNLEQVASECDIGLILGGHGATTTFLLAGKPLLIIPVVLEQALTGERVAELGAGLTASFDFPDSITSALESLAMCNRFQSAAKAFATKYKHHASISCAASVAARCEQLLD